MNREEIKTQAKKIIDEFIVALEKTEKIEEKIGFNRDEFLREGKKNKPDEEFKKRILKNAPKKKDDYIVAEKKSW